MTPAVRALAKAGIVHRVLRYLHDPRAAAYGEEAADALGLDPAQVFKTLVVQTADGDLAVAVVPVSRRLDLRALARLLGVKRAELAEPRRAERASGYVVGGISPVGQKRRLRTAIDLSAFSHPVIYVSAGRRGLEIEIAPDDLCELTAARRGKIAG